MLVGHLYVIVVVGSRLFPVNTLKVAPLCCFVHVWYSSIQFLHVLCLFEGVVEHVALATQLFIPVSCFYDNVLVPRCDSFEGNDLLHPVVGYEMLRLAECFFEFKSSLNSAFLFRDKRASV